MVTAYPWDLQHASFSVSASGIIAEILIPKRTILKTPPTAKLLSEEIIKLVLIFSTQRKIIFIRNACYALGKGLGRIQNHDLL